LTNKIDNLNVGKLFAKHNSIVKEKRPPIGDKWYLKKFDSCIEKQSPIKYVVKYCYKVISAHYKTKHWPFWPFCLRFGEMNDCMF
jgi:hypothetical protein